MFRTRPQRDRLAAVEVDVAPFEAVDLARLLGPFAARPH
jgi:hypothetical protein